MPPKKPATAAAASTAATTKCKVALDAYASAAGVALEELETVDLCGHYPPIDRMDASVGKLKSCRQLSLSTNVIDRIAGLAGVERLEILSLGRNCLKKLDGIEMVASSLRQLWVSYNQLEKLAGIEKCPHLRVLYVSNNRLKDWTEISRLTALTQLEDLLLIGNPLYVEHRDAGTLPAYRQQVVKRLPWLKKLDGELVRAQDRSDNSAKESAMENG